jgi:hypothetical protein
VEHEEQEEKEGTAFEGEEEEGIMIITEIHSEVVVVVVKTIQLMPLNGGKGDIQAWVIVYV